MAAPVLQEGWKLSSTQLRSSSGDVERSNAAYIEWSWLYDREGAQAGVTARWDAGGSGSGEFRRRFKIDPKGRIRRQGDWLVDRGSAARGNWIVNATGPDPTQIIGWVIASAKLPQKPEADIRKKDVAILDYFDAQQEMRAWVDKAFPPVAKPWIDLGWIGPRHLFHRVGKFAGGRGSIELRWALGRRARTIADIDQVRASARTFEENAKRRARPPKRPNPWILIEQGDWVAFGKVQWKTGAQFDVMNRKHKVNINVRFNDMEGQLKPRDLAQRMLALASKVAIPKHAEPRK